MGWRRPLIVGLAAVTAGAGLLAVALRLLAPARVASAVSRALGDVPVQVARVGLSGLDPVIHDLVVAGDAPRGAAPLLRADRVRLRWRWRPWDGKAWPEVTEAIADGVDIDYLRAGRADNLPAAWRRAATASPLDAGRAQPARGPVVRARAVRLRALAQLGGRRVAIRIDGGIYDHEPDGHRTFGAAKTRLDVLGALTCRLDDLRVVREPGGGSRLAATAALAIPGAGTVFERALLQARAGDGRLTARLHAGPPGDEAAALQASLSADAERIEARLRATAMPLVSLAGLRAIGVEPAEGEVSVDLTVSGDLPAGPFGFDLATDVRGLDLEHPALDREPWREIEVGLRARGAYDRAAARLDVRDGTLTAFGGRVDISGHVDWGGVAARGTATLRAPRGGLPCAALLEAQAPSVRRALAGLDLRGRFAPALRLAFDASSWDDLELDFGARALCDVGAAPVRLSDLLAALAQGRPPVGAARTLPLGPYHADFARLDRLPAHLPAAFVTAEDGRFFEHRGFDLPMIRTALAHDLATASLAKGASTITQQVAKNLFLSPDRTIARKLAEMVYAWRLEEHLDKRRILELYLNLVELGPGIRGVEQAARAYFGKPARLLSPIEAAHLAALTPNPRGLARRFRDGRVDDDWLGRLLDLLGMMRRSGRLSDAQLASARAARLTLRKI